MAENSDFMKWQTAGHEVMYDRSTYRHKAFRKHFASDAIIKVDGVPLLLHGKTVKVADTFPERADLALDEDGNLVTQHEFSRRYKDWLTWFSWNEATDLSAEPIPGVLEYVTATYDRFSESRGLVEINFDARKPAEEVATHKYDPNSDKLIEMAETQATIAKGLEYLLEQNLNKRGPGRPPKDE